MSVPTTGDRPRLRRSTLLGFLCGLALANASLEFIATFTSYRVPTAATVAFAIIAWFGLVWCWCLARPRLRAAQSENPPSAVLSRYGSWCARLSAWLSLGLFVALCTIMFAARSWDEGPVGLGWIYAWAAWTLAALVIWSALLWLGAFAWLLGSALSSLKRAGNSPV